MAINERGVLPESRFYPHEPSQFAQQSLFYVPFSGEYHCEKGYAITRGAMEYPYMLLFCVTEGALHVEVEGCAQTVRAGQALVIDCRRPHHYEAAGNLWFRWAGFWGMASEAYHGLLQERFGGPADLAAPSQAAACAEALFAQLRAERHAEHAVSAAVHMLLSALADMRTGTPGAAEQAVDRAAAFLRAHFAEPIQLGDAARVANMSPYHFSRQFKKYQGTTPHEFLLCERMAAAKLLLLSTGESIENIAASCGFASASHFIRAFRGRNGITPMRFRQMRF